MTYEQINMEHSGGTKAYTLILVRTADGKSLFINKWGKVGAFGELQATPFPTIDAGRKAFDKKERSKTSGGYRQKGPGREVTVENAEQLKNAFGLGIWSKVGGSNIQHLDPSINVTGMREADPARFDENGNFTGDKPRKAEIDPAEVEAEKARKLAEQQEKLRAIPNFGRFG